MKIAVVGTGYVGLVSGTCFAEMGVTTTCVDIDQNKIASLKEGIMPIYEPGLEEMVKRNCDKGTLFFTTSLEDAIVDVDAVFIAVGTPPDEDGSADLQYVLSVAKEIGEHMSNYLVIVDKSTVPIGTAQKVRSTVQTELDNRNVDIKFDVASNPEFLREGVAIDDFLKPDRVVVGVDSKDAEHTMERLYRPFLEKGQMHKLLFMDVPSAEMTKYTANAMLATRISFMNDIANLCEIVGADISNVRRGIGTDTRIGSKFLNAGIGYGGSCFPKDVQALMKTAKENGHDLRILDAVETVNADQKLRMFDKINQYFNNDLKDRRIALWGLSFKPDTDDMREAPSVILVNQLIEAGANIVAYDPEAMVEAKRIIGDKINYAEDKYDAVIDADALVIVTEWSEFKLPKFTYLENNLKNKLIFDGRNIYNPEEMREFGYTYFSIGR